jgi:pyruvate-ferredoxin/flavodoxin oxidoreductase
MAKIVKTMDGNTAAAYSAYAFTEVAGIYPISPSTTMSELTDEWAANGRKNIFGQTVNVVQMQSEAGAIGAVHGSLSTGALTTTYTASQGLLLMIPSLYKLAGELLPSVIHVSARAIATHALSIFGDHSDVMAVRQTGVALLSSNSVQEAMDLAAVAHLATIKSRVPFIHFFDGYRTSHELQKIECLDYEDLAKIVDMDSIQQFRDRAANPENPTMRGSAQNEDIFFQAREASNEFYNKLPQIVEDKMKDINKITGRDYQLFNYYGAPDAERIIIAMGSGCEAIEETVDYLTAKGEKVGLLKIRLYRPFSIKHFLKAIPDTVTKISVMDRTKEPGAIGDPMYLDVCTAYFEKEGKKPLIVGGRYGLASKDFDPTQVVAIFDNLKEESPKNHFTVGINDDVTNKSLKLGEPIVINDEGTISCKIWGLGSDGTVGANKNSIAIIGDNTDMFAQAYFSYDSKKSGGITQSHLRFGKNPIRSTYLVKQADFVACHNPSYLNKYDMMQDVKPGGTFLLNCIWSNEEIEDNIPNNIKKYMAQNNIKFFTIDGFKIAKELGLKSRINTILQAAFFKLSNIIPEEEAIKYMKQAVIKSYGKKGEKIVNMNNAAIEAGMIKVQEVAVKEEWKNLEQLTVQKPTKQVPKYISTLLEPINDLKGNDIPVSAFKGYEDGVFPTGTTAYEKRGIAVEVPQWIPENCIQCNQCAYVCPHAVIRPFLLSEEEKKNAPEGMITLGAAGKGVEGLEFVIQVDPLDCTGCGSCAQVCPAKTKALVMAPISQEMDQQSNWDYALTLSKKDISLATSSVKGSQFEQPLMEFSGACAGCGETPYAKLVTQLYGDRMYIANATGCSSIWGGSAPSTPYTVNAEGKGPAWANSLFENNAEFGYGMTLGAAQIREGIALKVNKLINLVDSEENKKDLQYWLDNINNGKETKLASVALTKVLEQCENNPKTSELAKDLLKNKNHFTKKSQWLFGGDGWAYDIGFGGLDHVIATGADVNILIFDTEMYSNTGGQMSKATPRGATAKFAVAGKMASKKDLGMIAMSYNNVYVAQIAMGANQAQTLKAIIEAESFPGPSIIIAYSPCISHGIDMGDAQGEIKRAVECGYWNLYRFNPLLVAEGKNPLIIDSKEPTGDYKEFLRNEGRFSALVRTFPDVAEELFEESEQDAKRRLEVYKKLAAK